MWFSLMGTGKRRVSGYFETLNEEAKKENWGNY
jgi:hypothetical protein